MKKSAFLFILAALGLASCSDSEYTYHQTAFYPLTSTGLVLYADQTVDSTTVLSTEPWTSTCTETWFTVSPSSVSTATNQAYNSLMLVSALQNTTGTSRFGAINVQGYDLASMLVTQLGWLNITTPNPHAAAQTGGIATQATFDLSLRSTTTDTALVFTTYQDGATLSVDAPWITPAATTAPAGRQTIGLTFEPNTTGAERTATMKLTSGLVTTEMTVTQPAI